MEPLSIAFTTSLADPSNPTSQNGRSPKPAGSYSVAAPWLHRGLWLPRGYPAATPWMPSVAEARTGPQTRKHDYVHPAWPPAYPLACPPVVPVVPRLSSRGGPPLVLPLVLPLVPPLVLPLVLPLALPLVLLLAL